MVRIAIADDYLLTYISRIAKLNSCAVGLILGQSCLGKDYVIHFAKTPPFQTEDLKKEGQPPRELKSVSEINENWIADHARHATRMLPGGMYVLGIFVTSPEDLLSPFSPKIKSVLSMIHKQLDVNHYLYGNANNEKLILHYSTKTQKYLAKSYDVATSNVQPAEFKFLPKASRWTNVECYFEIDQLHYLKTNEADWPLQKHMKIILEEINESLDNGVFLFDGEAKDKDENLENIGKKKKVTRTANKGLQDLQENSKPMQVSIYQTCNLNNSKKNPIHEIFESGGQLRIVGQVACKLWLQPKISINDASIAVKQDIMRSLATRLEMHWDSLTEEENSEDNTDYYNSALESESEEVLPKLPTDTNKFMYIVGLGVALLVLILSLLIHFYK
ncbi:hypothetical protein NQ314_002595 [Rhamnusium bicolor]|uniref:Protein odr-4 homolog n=1 Tax=Rhamnusium bicolor TaxID=1586634 RepID=A0AAV8ZQH7_9CUCU|nr:hypothetical protein NQ314_002595 [Rhamnusium bicolor]